MPRPPQIKKPTSGGHIKSLFVWRPGEKLRKRCAVAEIVEDSLRDQDFINRQGLVHDAIEDALSTRDYARALDQINDFRRIASEAAEENMRRGGEARQYVGLMNHVLATYEYICLKKCGTTGGIRGTINHYLRLRRAFRDIVDAINLSPELTKMIRDSSGEHRARCRDFYERDRRRVFDILREHGEDAVIPRIEKRLVKI